MSETEQRLGSSPPSREATSADPHNGFSYHSSSSGAGGSNSPLANGHGVPLPKTILDPFDTHNPFESANVKSYSHRANIVPPYVLDRLSQVHYKDQLNNQNTNATSTEPPELTNIQRSHTNATGGHHHKHTPSVSAIIKPLRRDKHDSRASGGVTPTGPGYNTGDDERQFSSFANDPFVKSLGNNWHNFLHTVQQPKVYTSDLLEYDAKFNSDCNLEGGWGGEERLKNALLRSTSAEDEAHGVSHEKSQWFARLFTTSGRGSTTQGSSKLNRELNEPSPRVRSKAGYWMSDEKRADLKPTLKRIFMQNPLIPLLLRVLIIVFSVLSLALACSIFHLSRREQSPVPQQPSTIMAIVVQCFAITYLAYISYDEYHGKPLGLRDPVDKMKLILLDLLFIIFSSANLSLAFNTLYDPEWVCESFDYNVLSSIQSQTLYPKIGSICRRQRALSSFLFLVLGFWVVTFTISTVRVVDKVSSGNPRSD
ncbi:Regulator of phospholipase D SRF1 [[Candida] zeylanoides]